MAQQFVDGKAQRVIDTENTVYHPDECLTPQRISGNLIAYSWLCFGLLIVVTSLKNGDKNTAHTSAPGRSFSAKRRRYHEFTRVADVPEYIELILGHCEA